MPVSLGVAQTLLLRMSALQVQADMLPLQTDHSVQQRIAPDARVQLLATRLVLTKMKSLGNRRSLHLFLNC
jgi:hypothetical protein